jgi:hypothetical protein
MAVLPAVEGVLPPIAFVGLPWPAVAAVGFVLPEPPIPVSKLLPSLEHATEPAAESSSAEAETVRAVRARRP